MQETIKMKKAKTTKSTDVYEADQSLVKPSPITTLYIMRWWSQGTEEIEITIKKEGE